MNKVVYVLSTFKEYSSYDITQYYLTTYAE
jgi:hypothetical protein